MVFDRYAFSEIPTAPEKGMEEGRIQDLLRLPEPERALLLHLGKYLTRKETNALLARFRKEKDEYDRSGEAYKTPFSLRNVKDPIARAFIIANSNYYASTFGCSGACEWCAVDALPMKEPIHTEPEQTEHFFGEFVEVIGDPKKLQQVMFYGDSDPFDDPNIVEIMKSLYQKFGATPGLSTVIPTRGEDAFKYLAIGAKLYKDVRALKALPEAVAQLQRAALEFGGRTFKEVQRMYEKLTRVETLESQFDFAEDHIDMTVAWFLKPMQKYALDPALIDEEEGRYKKTITTVLSSLEHYRLKPLKDLTDDEMPDYLRQIRAKRLQEEPEIQTYDKSFGRNYGYKIEPILYKIEEALKAFSLGSLDRLIENDPEAFAEINRIIDQSERVLQENGVPDVGAVRVSVIGRRAGLVKELMDAEKYSFYTIERDGSAYTGKPMKNDQLYTIGKARQKAEIQEDSPFSINCNNGIEITPFALFNEVSGFVTKEFPQGRILAPFIGLEEGNELAPTETDLGKILPHVIVINEWTYHGVSGGAPNHVYVYDGDHRIRKIIFDQSTYRVIEDRIFREDVTSIDQIKDINIYFQKERR